jgi:hypothetical protein
MKQLRRGNAILRAHHQQRTHIKPPPLAILETQLELKIWRSFYLHNIKQQFSPHWIPACAG